MQAEENHSQSRARSGDGPDFDMLIGWGRTPTGEMIPEESLPDMVVVALASLRAEDPSSDYEVLAIRSLLDGVEQSRSGPRTKLPADAALLVLSLVDTRMTVASITVLAYMVVLRKAAAQND